ncbi:MAG: thioredoxin family protein [Muribaculaceae bacterium]|nr:thioredoxin family protein [Muribaculaceae bacterium]
MNYNEAINSSKVVLVEFFASWCPHCQRMMPIVAQIKELLQGTVDIYQFDIDEYADLAAANGANSVPTFIIYKDGEEQWRESGEIDGQVLLSKIESYLR